MRKTSGSFSQKKARTGPKENATDVLKASKGGRFVEGKVMITAPATAKKSSLPPVLQHSKSTSKVRGRSKSPSKVSVGKYDPRAPGLEMLGRCKFLFLRRVEQDMGFFMEALSAYEVYLPSGSRIYYIKEMKGDGERDTAGAQRSIILCILSSLGRELLRMEGTRGSAAELATMAVYQGPSYIGEAREKKSACGGHVFRVTDDNNNSVVEIQPCQSEGSTCYCFKRSLIDERYDIILPPQMTRIGTMGKIAKLFPEVSRELDDCIGVELSDALNIREKALLLASVFVLFPRLSSPTKTSVLQKVRDSVSMSFRGSVNSKSPQNKNHKDQKTK